MISFSVTELHECQPCRRGGGKQKDDEEEDEENEDKGPPLSPSLPFSLLLHPYSLLLLRLLLLLLLHLLLLHRTHVWLAGRDVMRASERQQAVTQERNGTCIDLCAIVAQGWQPLSSGSFSQFHFIPSGAAGFTQGRQAFGPLPVACPFKGSGVKAGLAAFSWACRKGRV